MWLSLLAFTGTRYACDARHTCRQTIHAHKMKTNISLKNFVFYPYLSVLNTPSYNMWLSLSSVPSPPTCSLCCSIHPRDKQTVAYRLHLGARAVAYGEKNLTFQGPLPKKIELLAHNGLLNLTYDQEIQVQRQDNRTFEVRLSGGKMKFGFALW